jgi:hypothetical protein
VYDLIGDIHGHANALQQLLEKLGYQCQGEVYQHPVRQVIFLGDFIDRGPQIREVLGIVRPMVDAGHALAVMGNHELNALAFHEADPELPGEYLRRHNPKHLQQHEQTLQQLSPPELVAALDWFQTLPLWLDLDGLRVVHACWDEQAVASITQGLKAIGGNTSGFLLSACKQGKPLYSPVETLLKGKEGKLPEGKWFADKDGHVRTEVRTRWYLPPQGQTYRSYAFYSDEIDCDLELDRSVLASASPYPAQAKPIFVGHYWLSAQRPATLTDNVACLDYSVAKDGFLCAYCWQGEQKLKNEHFVWVPHN